MSEANKQGIRELFIDYLKAEIIQDNQIIEQLEKINPPEVLTKKYKAELLAMKVVLNRLESTETEHI